MKIRELLSEPKHWTQGAFAKDCDGITVPPSHPRAVCWCLIGAAHRCYPNLPQRSIALKQIEDAIVEEGFCDDIADFNDHNGHEYIMELLERIDV